MLPQAANRRNRRWLRSESLHRLIASEAAAETAAQIHRPPRNWRALLLQEHLVGVLEHEQDDTYLMQKENFKLGGILLAKALISDEQLNHALEVQNREKGTKLGGILYELGYIGPEDLKRCLDLQEHLYFRKDSYLIGAIALKFALIDQRQLKEGLRLQESIFREKRKHQQLGEILLSKGYISQQTLDFILSIQRLTAEN